MVVELDDRYKMWCSVNNIINIYQSINQSKFM